VVEAGRDDMACLLEVVVCLLHRPDLLDLREARDRLRLDVDDDAARDVVDDDRPVGGFRDLLEVGDDASLRRLVVVRRDNEDAVGAELVRVLREAHGVPCRVGPGGRHDGRPLAHGLDRCADQVVALAVRERRALARRADDDEPVGAVVDEVQREALERVERSPVLVERVAIAVRTEPSIRGIVVSCAPASRPLAR
jgi:hypothetical protein